MTSSVAYTAALHGSDTQNYTSASTSINIRKAPAVYGNVTAKGIMRGKRVIDIGGGKFNTAVDKAREYGASVEIYDPFNRTEMHNRRVLSKRYDVAVISNVLNVIDDHSARMNVVRLALYHAPIVLVTVYEGNGSGIGAQSGIDSWQENRRTTSYETELRSEFPNIDIKRKGKLIVINNSLAF